MQCRKCKKLIDTDSVFCKYCGTSVTPKATQRKRKGNGTGTVERISANNYKAIAVVGWKEENGKKLPVRRTKSGFKTKSEATAYIPTLSKLTIDTDKTATLRAIFDAFIAIHNKGQSTINCYRSAFKWLSKLWYVPFYNIGIDDWQSQIDNCPKGKRTKLNMRVLIGLLYKYAIPRGYVCEALMTFRGEFLKVNDSSPAPHKEGFTSDELELIRKAVGKVDYADYIYCLCYLGFRLSEFLSLTIDSYNTKERCFVGGVKTDAGKDRTVTISPKIQGIVNGLTQKKNGYVFCDTNGNRFTERRFRAEAFYPTLEKIGISNTDHHYTPHSCRHTFATLMKRVQADSKDKLALIGHTSEDMLRYYQDVDYADLRKITDNI